MTETPSPAIGTQYPLLFTYRDTLFGNGRLVQVHAVNGRALCVKEGDDDFWVYGINPGGMAAHGDDPESAHAAFRKAFSGILIDLTQDAQSFDEFEASVKAFFEDTNAGYEGAWLEAVGGVKRGEVTLEGVPIVSAASPRSLTVTVKQVEQVTPQDNSAE